MTEVQLSMAFELFIGGRYLRAKQRQAFISVTSLLSVAGVAVGVMALIVVIAVMAGFEADLKSRILGVDSHVVVRKPGRSLSGYKDAARKIESIRGVEAVTPFVRTQVMLRTGRGVAGAVLRGIDPASAGRVATFIKAGHLDRLVPGRERPGRPGIILGKELARRMGVAAGETVSVISPRGMVSPIGHIPAMRPFSVVGFFDSGMYEYDGSLAYVHLADAQKMLRLAGAVTGIEIRVRDTDRAGEIADAVRQRLGSRFRVKDWMAMNRTLFSALKLEKTAMFVILTLIVLVAAFNIASSLIMMVMEKTKDIAILKAMGATDQSIRRIFIFKGVVIGAVGTALGGGAGVGLCALLSRYKFIELPKDVYYVTTLPVRLAAGDVAAIALAALAICFLATLYPARQAAALDPAEAIRYG